METCYHVDGQEVIVVVQSNSPSMKHDTEKEMPHAKKRGRGQMWRRICTVTSHDALQEWLKKRDASVDAQWRKCRHCKTQLGDKQYYRCHHGCEAELEALYENTSENVIISSNDKAHDHDVKRSSNWGLPEETKEEVKRILRSGTSRCSLVQAELRRRGFSGHSAKQVTSLLARLRRQSAELATPPAPAAGRHCGGDAQYEGGERPRHDGTGPERHSPEPGSPIQPVSSARSESPVMDASAVASLVESSRVARAAAYCPYSQFAVGAALLCADGTVVTGANVENASFGLTLCAERTAVVKAVSDGRRRFTAIAIAADMTDKFVGPCGACRQVLAEFNAEMPVFMAKVNGEVKTTSMSALLPMPFHPDDVPFKK